MAINAFCPHICSTSAHHTDSCAAHRVSLWKFWGLFQEQTQDLTEESKWEACTCCGREPQAWHMQMGCSSAPQGFNLLLQPWQRLCQLCFQQLHAAVPALSTALAARNAPAPAQPRPFSSHTTPQSFSASLRTQFAD